MKKEVLVIEDDPDIVELLRIHLEDLECNVYSALTGTNGLEMAEKGKYDLIILDLMLPEIDGLEICKSIRAQKVYTPVLMLTAKVEEIDKVVGLETGADDYMTKPFSVREFISRVKAIFRRVHMIEEQSKESKKKLEYKGLHIDLDKRKVVYEENVISLTPKEFDLLVLMASHPGRSYKRDELLNLVWGYEFSGYEHTVNSHVNRLRAKVEPDVNNPQFILTTWGIGYKFNDE
ncbi:MAG: response regulator transcription factor [Cyclobacteriaceae bacterium]|nr:response regulator transcription factor [Cyclobacteriaceae bacterium]